MVHSTVHSTIKTVNNSIFYANFNKRGEKMLTSKERAELRGEASKLDAIIQIGKDGINDALIFTTNQAINNRELIKVKVLENANAETKDMAETLAEKTSSQVVQVIGNKFVLYKENKDKKKK